MIEEYDVLVLGDGSAGSIVQHALMDGKKVALVDNGPLGGTCLNYGCIPSKMLMYPADRIMEIKDSEKLGVSAEVTDVDFQNIMSRMRGVIQDSHEHMEGIDQVEGLDYYDGAGSFVDDYTVEVDGERIRGKKIFIGTGARPLIPPIKGVEDVDYLTNETIFDLEEKPESLVIVGGGYIAVEFAHFFSAVGTKVTVIQRSNRLISNVESEISDLLKKKFDERMNVVLNTEVVELKKQKGKVIAVGEDKESGEKKSFKGEKVLIATGRKSNADVLKVENTCVETDEHGYIQVNDFLETSKENIWALGDATGRGMFKHVANEEAEIAWNNAMTPSDKVKLDYDNTPYAVFTYPEIAAVGLTEEEAKEDFDPLVGKAKYTDVAMGEAMVEKDGFAKIIVDHTGKILGFHIVGPYASILIQEVINAVSLDGKIGFIANGMHIHPALPELVLQTLGNLQHPAD
ncbi:MAG: dihydrolipoyl dehydrogenase [Candidatus Thermoplasmatota archaeon]